MNAVITSFTSTEKYGLTINEQTGEVDHCECKSFHFSGCKHTCKHSQEFDKELQRAATFILLQERVKTIEAQMSDVLQTRRILREMAFA